MCLTGRPHPLQTHLGHTANFKCTLQVLQSTLWAYTTRRSLEDRREEGRLPLLATHAALCLLSASASSSSAIASQTPCFPRPVDSWQCTLPVQDQSPISVFRPIGHCASWAGRGCVVSPHNLEACLIHSREARMRGDDQQRLLCNAECLRPDPHTTPPCGA